MYTILATLAAVVRCTSMNLPRVGVNPLSYPLSERRPGLYALNEALCRDFVSPRNTRKDYPAGFDAEGKTDTDLFFAHAAQGTGATGGIHTSGKKEIIILK